LDHVAVTNPDKKVGVDIVKKALQSPVRQIAENSGVDGSIIVGKLQDQTDPAWGYDAQKGEFTDLIKAGIVDPTKVVRIALQDAASIAGLLITTEAMIAEKPEKKAPPMPGGGMGGMGDMDF
jgi:chaperonin GroEL